MPRGGRGTARRVVLPYGWLRRAAAIARASGAQRSVCASGCEEISGNCGRDHPQSIQQPWTIPQSRRSRDSSLCTREPRDGGCGLPRRPCGPPRNDNGFLSFRGAERRGNPSFLRWTGVRAAVPGAWPPPTKFRAEIWGVSHRHRPLRVVAESCHDHPGSALSAERGAGQIQVLPDTLRVQHGVPCPEASARLRPCSRRGCVD